MKKLIRVIVLITMFMGVGATQVALSDKTVESIPEVVEPPLLSQEIKEPVIETVEPEEIIEEVPEDPVEEVPTWDYMFVITFYTELEGEGLGLTASGKPVAYGMLANNFLEFGTVIELDGMGTFVVEDRGSGVYFDRIERIDMYMPRYAGESDYDYQERVRAMGVVEVYGRILK